MIIKYHSKPVVDFESNSESVKSNKRFYSKKISKWKPHNQPTKVYRLSQTKIKRLEGMQSRTKLK